MTGPSGGGSTLGGGSTSLTSTSTSGTGSTSASGTSGGFGLEEIGIPGREYLREALTSCTDPLKAIEDFQVENGILLPSLRPMLPLLDLHGIKRIDFHNSVLEDLRDKLIAQIEACSKMEGKDRDKKLKDLLLKSFPVIKIKQLRPVVMAVLKNMVYIEDKYLRVLVRDKELYADCDIEIKRHLWRDNQSLFGDEVSPLLSQYIKDKEKVLFTYDTGPGFFAGSPKSRRQAEVVQKLAEMIGTNVKLYDMTLQFLRTLFLRTRNVHYCTLRSELLMALHDREVQDVISVDPCHKFTWCLDACIRERNVDVKRSRELQGFLDAIRRGQEQVGLAVWCSVLLLFSLQVLGDLSMTLCDPFAINFLSTSGMKLVNHCVTQEGLARDQPVLLLLLRMLALGLGAWEMIDSQDFREPRLESPLVLQFLPAMMSLIVDDQVRALNAKFPVEERDTASIIIDHSGPPPDMYDSLAGQSPIAAVMAMQYTLQTCKARDKTGLMRVLGILAQNIRGHPFEVVTSPQLHEEYLHCNCVLGRLPPQSGLRPHRDEGGVRGGGFLHGGF